MSTSRLLATVAGVGALAVALVLPASGSTATATVGEAPLAKVQSALRAAVSSQRPMPLFAGDEGPIPGDAVAAVMDDEGTSVVGGAAPLQAALDAVDPTDARSLVDALRAFLTSTTGLRFAQPDPRAPVEAVDPSDRTAVAYAYGFPAGDLDGDGLDDVIVYEHRDEDERATARALRGLDGRQLWVREAGGDDGVGFPVDDLDGDEVDDVMVWTWTLHEEEQVEDCQAYGDCRYRYDATFEWLVATQSGRDGRTLWEQRFPGEMHAAYDEEGTSTLLESRWEATHKVRTEHELVLPVISGDHNGDGGDEVVLSVLGRDGNGRTRYHRTATRTDRSGEDRERFDVTALVLAGGTGTPLVTFQSAGPTLGVLLAVGDRVSNAVPDLGWERLTVADTSYACSSLLILPEECTDPPEPQLVVAAAELIDGETFAGVWASSGEPASFAWHDWLDVDLTGDGRPDVLRSETTFSDEGESSANALLAGHDGQQAWRRSRATGFEFPLTYEHIGGGPGIDVLFGAFVRDSWRDSWDDVDFRVAFTRVEGATGNTLLHTEHTLASAGSSSAAGVFGLIGLSPDADGDGRSDVYASGVVVTWDAMGQRHEQSGGLAETSVAGTQLYRFSSDDVTLLFVEGDYDGDDLADARVETFTDHEPQPARAVRLVDGSVLWDVVYPEPGRLETGGDQDGVPGVELVRNAHTGTDDKTTFTVSSVSGRTGTVRWTYTAP